MKSLKWEIIKKLYKRLIRELKLDFSSSYYLIKSLVIRCLLWTFPLKCKTFCCSIHLWVYFAIFNENFKQYFNNLKLAFWFFYFYYKLFSFLRICLVINLNFVNHNGDNICFYLTIVIFIEIELLIIWKYYYNAFSIFFWLNYNNYYNFNLCYS